MLGVYYTLGFVTFHQITKQRDIESNDIDRPVNESKTTTRTFNSIVLHSFLFFFEVNHVIFGSFRRFDAKMGYPRTTPEDARINVAGTIGLGTVQVSMVAGAFVSFLFGITGSFV